MRDGAVAMTDGGCSIPGRQIKAVAFLAFRIAIGQIILRRRRKSSEINAEEEYEAKDNKE